MDATLAARGLSTGPSSVPVEPSSALPRVEQECWICRGEGTSRRPLLSRVCRCTGSIGLVHASCLRGWIDKQAANACPNCGTSYLWDVVVREPLPYPEARHQQVAFVADHLLLPLVVVRLQGIALLWLLQWLLLPMLLGGLFYVDVNSFKDMRLLPTTRECLDMWLVGIPVTAAVRTLQATWRGWTDFFEARHSRTEPPLEPLPMDELDMVYEEAYRAQHRAVGSPAASESSAGSSAFTSSASSASGGELSDETDASWALEGEFGLERPSNEQGGHYSATSETRPDSTTEASVGAGAEAIPAPTPQEEHGSAERANGDGATARRRVRPQTIVARRAGHMHPIFRALDTSLKLQMENAFGWTRSTAGRVAAAVVALFMLLLRHWLGQLVLFAAAMAGAVYVRQTYPRRRVHNPRRRFDEVCHRMLRSRRQVSQRRRVLLFLSQAAQTMLFTLVTPLLGGVVAHLAVAPLLAPLPASISAFFAGLTPMRLALYWLIGFSFVVGLMSVERSLMLLVFAPGVDLFYLRAVVLDMDMERVYYDIILANLFDIDVLGLMYEFFVVNCVELAALFVFLALPTWVVIGVREYAFGDISSGALSLPMPLLASTSWWGDTTTDRGGSVTTENATAAIDMQDAGAKFLNPELFLRQQTARVLSTPAAARLGVRAVGPCLERGLITTPVTNATAHCPVCNLYHDFCDEGLSGDGSGRSEESLRTNRNEPSLVMVLALAAAAEGDLHAAQRLQAACTDGQQHDCRDGRLLLRLLLSPRLWGPIVRVLGRAGGHCTVTLLYAALSVPTAEPHTLVDARGEQQDQSMYRCVGKVLVGDASAGAQEDAKVCCHHMATLAPPGEIDSCPTVTAAHGSHRGPDNCLGTFLATMLHQVPLLSRLERTALVFPLGRQWVTTHAVDALAAVLLLADILFLSLFIDHQLPLASLRKAAHGLAKIVGGLDAYLFDDEFAALYETLLAQGGENEVAVAVMPPQRAVLRRTRFFAPDALPSDLCRRCIVYAILFHLVTTIVFWMPVLVVFLALVSLQHMTSSLATGLSFAVIFAALQPVHFLMSLALAFSSPFAMIMYLCALAYQEAATIFPGDLVHESWLYATKAYVVLREYREDADETLGGRDEGGEEAASDRSSPPSHSDSDEAVEQ